MTTAIPVLCAHGIGSNAGIFDALRGHLARQGFYDIHTFDFRPNDGAIGIAELAKQLDAEAQVLRARTKAERINLVGFSMGALVSRYWLQRMNGKGITRRFISISGPHAGTVLAFARDNAAIRDMRPRSALLQDLAEDRDPWGNVEVHVFRTPYDLMIVPSRSSSLPNAREQIIPVKVHRWMASDVRVLKPLGEILLAPP